jgi:DNA repair exonuclease SbcCD ATPase subunit
MRNQEARSKADDVWKAIDERLATLPVAQSPAPPAEEPVPEKPESISEESAEPAVPSSPTTPSSKPVTIADVTDKESDRVSIATFRRATEQHVAEVLETVRFEREEFARERAALDAKREEALQKAEEERNKALADRDDRIRALEEELQKVKDELANEREARLTEEAAAREQDRTERLERDTAFERQLGDITNLVQEQRDDCERKKEEEERNREEKERRRNAKEYSMFELRDMVTKLHDDLANDRERAEADRSLCATKEGSSLRVRSS